MPEEAVDKDAKDEAEQPKFMKVETGGEYWTTGAVALTGLRKTFRAKRLCYKL